VRWFAACCAHVVRPRCSRPRDLVWSTETVGPDLANVIDDALMSIRSNPEQPARSRAAREYARVLCPLRDDTQRLLGVVAVVAAPRDAQDAKTHDFALRTRC